MNLSLWVLSVVYLILIITEMIFTFYFYERYENERARVKRWEVLHGVLSESHRTQVKNLEAVISGRRKAYEKVIWDQDITLQGLKVENEELKELLKASDVKFAALSSKKSIKQHRKVRKS